MHYAAIRTCTLTNAHTPTEPNRRKWKNWSETPRIILIIIAHLWCVTDVRVHQVIAFIVHTNIVILLIIVYLISMLRLISVAWHLRFALVIGQLFAFEIAQRVVRWFRTIEVIHTERNIVLNELFRIRHIVIDAQLQTYK